jgi:hypothetical protein
MYLVWKLNNRIVIKNEDDDEEDTADSDGLQALRYIAKEFKPQIRKVNEDYDLAVSGRHKNPSTYSFGRNLTDSFQREERLS